MKNCFFRSTVLITLVLLIFSSVLYSQTEMKEKRPLPLPMIPLLFEYQYAPQYFAQWIEKAHPQYSMIEAILDENSTLQIILTEQGETGKRVYYSNSEDKVKALQAEGKEAYWTKIDFKTTQAVDRQPSYGFGFLDKNRQPILWRVIPASKPSERGAGPIQYDDALSLRLEYRDLGTAIGEGTAIQIGEQVIEAQPWREISSPPYFVAYRGSVTQGRHIGAILYGTKKWSVVKQPEQLKKGAEWVMADERGNKHILRVVSDHQDELVVDEVDPPSGKNSLWRLVIHLTPQGYNLRAVEIKSRRQDMRIKFEPELPLQSNDSAKFEGKFIINQGDNKSVAAGAIIAEQKTGGKLRLKWLPYTPAWAKSKAFESIIGFEPDGYSISTKHNGN